MNCFGGAPKRNLDIFFGVLRRRAASCASRRQSLRRLLLDRLDLVVWLLLLVGARGSPFD